MTIRGFILVLFIVLVCEARAQQRTFADSVMGVYKLHDVSQNVVNNREALAGFYEKLFQLKSNDGGVVNIVHIGDSHIQADYLTSVVRRHLQQYFGNAGRGLVVPYQVAGTNTPPNIISTSDTIWRAKRCVHVLDTLPIGIGGITIATHAREATLNFIMNDLWMEYPFQKVGIFTEPFHGTIIINDTSGVKLAKFPADTTSFFQTSFPENISSISLQFSQTSLSQEPILFYGVNLLSGTPGVVYHAIGVNGAKYEHYNAAAKFVDQTSSLNPDLFIISLGTNEAIKYPVMDENIESHVRTLINSLKQKNPNAAYLLITPPDAFRQKTKPNPGIKTVRKAILNVAVENGLSFYDLYKAIGGDKSAQAWHAAGLLRSDGVHFSKDGYAYQGSLFFNALMNGYNEYVSLRR
ncbi:MAG TPA: GDSL-type esterase/lipase family protein [Chryseosolibacter sp.]|nr:GDSL-type esterase/lipase family protein [Chryseosolibacter sp.]